MQTGGQLPFLTYTPVMVNQESGKGAQRASSSDKNKTENFLEKSILKTLEENALDIDHEVFSAYAYELLNDPMGIEGFQGDFSASVSKLIQLRKIANQLKTSKQLYDDAINHVRTNNTGDDYAMTSDGKVYVVKAGDENNKLHIDTIKIDTLKDSLDTYTPLTNNQLLDIRNNGKFGGIAVSENVAFNESFLRDVNASIGMQNVMEAVDTVIKRFGTAKRTGNTIKTSKEVEEGLEGLYQVTVEQSNAMISPESRKAAAKFIYSNLNNNAKNVLKLNAEINGLDTIDYLVNTIILSSDSITSEIFKESIDSSGKPSSASGGDKPTERSFINTVVLGDAVEDTQILISGTENAGIKLKGQVYGFRDEDGNKITMNNLEQILSQEKNALGNVVDLNSVSIGNSIVNNLDLHKLVYDGSSTLNRMVLPIDEDVYHATGKIKPDLDALKKFKTFQDWSKNNPNASPQEQAMKLKELDVNVKYDSKENGWKFVNTRVFLTLNGYVSDEVINIEDSDKQFLSHMDKATRKNLLPIYENYVNYGQAAKDKDKEHPNSINLVSMLDWVGQDNLYQGMIFMPVLGRGMEYIAHSNELVPKSEFMDMKNQRSIQDQQRNFRNNF